MELNFGQEQPKYTNRKTNYIMCLKVLNGKDRRKSNVLKRICVCVCVSVKELMVGYNIKWGGQVRSHGEFEI